MTRFCDIPLILRTLLMWVVVCITLYLVLYTGLLPWQTEAIAGETTELLVGFKAGAVIEPLPAAVMSWRRIAGSLIVRMKVASAQADAVIEQLKQRPDEKRTAVFGQ